MSKPSRIWLSYTGLCLALNAARTGKHQKPGRSAPQLDDAFFFGCSRQMLGEDPFQMALGERAVPQEILDEVRLLVETAPVRFLADGMPVQNVVFIKDLPQKGDPFVWKALAEMTGDVAAFEAALEAYYKAEETRYGCILGRDYCYPTAVAVLSSMGIEGMW